MIRINVVTKNIIIESVTLKGHANYDDYGKDIVCAAVSATYLCTVNAILSLKNNSIDVVNKEDLQIIKVLEFSNITNSLLDNMINCLESLQKQYPKNINLDKEEK